MQLSASGAMDVIQGGLPFLQARQPLPVGVQYQEVARLLQSSLRFLLSSTPANWSQVFASLVAEA